MTRRGPRGPLNCLYDEAFAHMEHSVDALASVVPAPRSVKMGGGRVFRYEERLPQQAVVLKLARLVSALRATRLLLDHGYVQEVATLERVIGEVQEDVFFLVSGYRSQDTLYRRFLKDFWQDEFDDHAPLASTQKRDRVPRRKIQAHIGRVISGISGAPSDLSRTIEQFRTIGNRQSDYVHGAGPRLLELFGGEPPHFHMGGMLGTEQESGHRRYFWDYVYRSICVFAMVTRAFGDSVAGDKIMDYLDRFERSELVDEGIHGGPAASKRASAGR